jgi:hypothetical protein
MTYEEIEKAAKDYQNDDNRTKMGPACSFIRGALWMQEHMNKKFELRKWSICDQCFCELGIFDVNLIKLASEDAKLCPNCFERYKLRHDSTER